MVGAGFKQRMEVAGRIVARELELSGGRKQKIHLGGGDGSGQCAWRRVQVPAVTEQEANEGGKCDAWPNTDQNTAKTEENLGSSDSATHIPVSLASAACCLLRLLPAACSIAASTFRALHNLHLLEADRYVRERGSKGQGNQGKKS